MDLHRAADLLELEIAELRGLPSWRRRDLENVAFASIRAMREAAERLEHLERSSAAVRRAEADDGRVDRAPREIAGMSAR